MFLPSTITLQFGDSGDFVTELQRRLCVVQCFSEDMINGFFDGTTVSGVTRFQTMVGLHADGVAGPSTLRRLNGVIAGDTSGSATDDKKEEEKSLHDQTQSSMQLFYGTPSEQPDLNAWGTPAETRVREDATPQAPVTPTVALDPLQQQPIALQEQVVLREQLQQQSVASVLLDQQPPREQPFETLREPPHSQQTYTKPFESPARPHERPTPNEPVNSPTRPPVIESVVSAPEQTAPSTPIAEPVRELQPQRGGIIGRITQFANATIQKLSEYFERKLPPDTLKEVRDIGLAMAATGMKETAIPTGPSLPPPGPTPGRGQEAQRG